jgi:hypothetical protein
VKKLWPALLAVAVLLVLYFVMRRHGGEDAMPAPAPTPQALADSTGPHAAPPAVLPAPVAGAPSTGDTGDTGETGDEHRGSGPIVGTPHLAENPPDMTPKKGKITLDEKLAETAKHIQVMKRRTELLQTEIDQLDKAGKTKEAAEQRIVLERLEKHMKELQTAIDEHKEPM